MRRRAFIAVLGGAAIASPFAARAQQAQRHPRRIGVLIASDERDQEYLRYLAAFQQEFAAAGWHEGGNVEIVYRWAGPDAEAIRRFAKELVAAQPEVILSSSTVTTIALLHETQTIPVVFVTVVDPIGSGLVKSLAKPGANATGFTNLDPKMTGKWLELLKTIAPSVTGVAILYNPGTETYFNVYLDGFRAAAPALGMAVMAKPVHNSAEIEAVMAALAQDRTTGVIPMPGAFTTNHRAEITSLVARNRIPAVYAIRAFVDVGGILSYGNDNDDNWRRAADYLDRILRGDKPSELPVQFPVKFELVVNLKAAKAQGIAIPPTLLATADQVIE